MTSSSYMYTQIIKHVVSLSPLFFITHALMLLLLTSRFRISLMFKLEYIFSTKSYATSQFLFQADKSQTFWALLKNGWLQEAHNILNYCEFLLVHALKFLNFFISIQMFCSFTYRCIHALFNPSHFFTFFDQLFVLII